MAKKKNVQVQASQEEQSRAQDIFQRYRQIANALYKAADQTGVEAALADINALPEAAQIALLQLLAREHSTDSADVLLALNELSPGKPVRKEARRSLIRLEAARIYPRWQPPIIRAPAVVVNAQPATFWQGVVSDTFDAGEVNLLLSWQQADGQFRLMGFLLEFWTEGVKDFLTEVASKHHIQEHFDEMNSLETKPCTLADARRLIQDALDVNQRTGTQPHRDYRRNLSLIKRLILDATDVGEDSGVGHLHNNLEPVEVVTKFVEDFIAGRYGYAYDLLSSDSLVRAELSRQDWVKQREDWAQVAKPEGFNPGFADERRQRSSGLWLPNPFGGKRTPERKEIEAAWSFELTDTPLAGELKELPTATASLAETRRHWFWASYPLVQEDGEWRIQDIVDESATARQLSIDALEKRINEQSKRIEKVTKQHKPTDSDALDYLGDVVNGTMRNLNYTDALLEKMPLDRHIYELQAARTIMVQDLERTLIYLEELVQRFPEGRILALQQLAASQQQLAQKTYQDVDDERAEHLLELAIANLRRALDIEDSAFTHMLLAEVLGQRDDDGDVMEAKNLLLTARALTTDTKTLASIEDDLADIARDEDDFEQALQHYQRILEIDPDDAKAWFDIGKTCTDMDNNAEAERSFKHALQLEPDYVEVYPELLQLYLADGRTGEGNTLIEEGLRQNPDSVQLRLTLLPVLIAFDDFQQARKMLDEAENLDPDELLLPIFRAMLESVRPKPLATPRLPKARMAPGKAKKRKRR